MLSQMSSDSSAKCVKRLCHRCGFIRLLYEHHIGTRLDPRLRAAAAAAAGGRRAAGE